MDDADIAYEKAAQEIARVNVAVEQELRLTGGAFRALNRLPPELANLTGLRSLHLDFTQISDLTPLQNLKNLQRLELFKTKVSDLSPLKSLTNLETLGLNSTDVNDLSPLQGLKRLQEIVLSHTMVSDLLPLKSLTNLQVINLNNTKVSDLSPLRGLIHLEEIILDHTLVNDLSPLQTLTKLRTLFLDDTKVSDLRPIAGLEQIASEHKMHGITFRFTPATKLDPRLAELAEINDRDERVRQTLEYLRRLPSWPSPYIPNGSPKQPIVSATEKTSVKAAKAQIRYLLQNPVLTRLSAQQFAGQIKDALREVPATQGNKLAEPLQTMLEFAEALELLAPTSELATDQLDRGKLELRIAHLEALVIRLGQQLHEEIKAREATDALTRKGEFGREFAKEAGKQTAQLMFWVPKIVVGVGVYQAATHFLGVGNPVLEVFSRFVGKVAE